MIVIFELWYYNTMATITINTCVIVLWFCFCSNIAQKLACNWNIWLLVLCWFIHLLVKLSIVAREVACSASDLQGLNFESCVWRAVSSHHPQEVFLARFSLYVHKSGLKPDSFHFCWFIVCDTAPTFNRRCRIYSGFHFLFAHQVPPFNHVKDKMWQQSARFENSWPPFCQIWIIFTHLKLWIASARHKFKWVKIQTE